MGAFQGYKPEFPNPYPDHWTSVSDFTYLSDLYICRARTGLTSSRDRETQYLVYGEYRVAFKVDGRRQELAVPSGMLTDLASVPAIARPIVDRVGPHLEASIVHDFLFLAWQDLAGHKARKQDFHFANEVLLAGLKSAGMGLLKRQLIYRAVSSFVGYQIYRDENAGTRYVKVPPMSP